MTQLNASAVLSDVLSAEARLSNVVQGSEPATGNAAAEDVLSGKTFSNSAESGITGSMPNIGAQNITPSTAIQLIAKGYHNGSGAVAGDADLIPSNIKTGVSIFGVNGNVVPEDFSEVNEALDSLNQEIIGSDPLVKISFAEGWRDDVKDSIAAYGVSMTGAKPADYDSKVALIGAAVAAPLKSALDAANEEASADLTAGIALVDANYGEISAAIAAAGVSMTGVKPSGYDAKIAEAVAKATNEALFNFRASDKTIYSGGYNAEAGGTDCIIPDTIGGVAVEHIAFAAFDKVDASGARGAEITALILPGGLKTIGDYAARENNIAGNLAIPATVTTIGGYAFMNNLIDSLTFASGGALTAIPTTCFLGNRIAGKLTFPSPIATIGFNSFNTNLIDELDFADTVTTIDQYAFRMNNVVKIKIGANVTINASPLLDTMGVYGNAFETLYNGNGKLAGTYEYSAGTWSKTA